MSRVLSLILAAGTILFSLGSLMNIFLLTRTAASRDEPPSPLYPLDAQLGHGRLSMVPRGRCEDVLRRLDARYGGPLPFEPPLLLVTPESYRAMVPRADSPPDRVFGRSGAPCWEPFDLRGVGIPALYSPRLRRAFVFEDAEEAVSAALTLHRLDFNRLFPAGEPSSFPTLDMLCRQVVVLREAADFTGDERLAPDRFVPAGPDGKVWAAVLRKLVPLGATGGTPPRFTSNDVRKRALAALGLPCDNPRNLFIVAGSPLAVEESGGKLMLAAMEYRHAAGGARLTLFFSRGSSPDFAALTSSFASRGVKVLEMEDRRFPKSMALFVPRTSKDK